MPVWRATALRSDRDSLAAFLGYASLSTIYLGLPLLTSSQSRYVGDRQDATLHIWSFAWWPHAIIHGLNPIVSHFVWAPDGVDLMWIGSVPGLAIPFAPLTLIVGPVAAYNVAAVLAPAFAAWAAFLLCRHLTRARWASVVGGLLFGMSSFELKHMTAAHLSLTAAGALVPLVALIILRFLDGELAARGLVLRLGVLLAFELLISIEILFTTALAIVVATTLGYLLVPARRQGLVALVRNAVCAYVLAGLLTAPFVYYLLTDLHRESFASPKASVADALSFLVPTNSVLTGAGGVGNTISAHLAPVVSTSEVYAVYLGLPIVLVTVLFAWRRLRTSGGRFVIAAFAAAVIATMGPWLIVAGHRIVSLPWRLVYQLPLFNNVLPVRLSLYVALAASVVVALWMAEQRAGAVSWLLPVFGILALVPNPYYPRSAAYAVQPFFTSGAYANCLNPGETILPLPIGQGEAMLWQAESGFRFKIAGGFTGLYRPRGFLHPWSMYYVTVGYHLGSEQVRYVRSFIKRKDVAAAVVDGNELDFFRGALDPLAAPQTVGGVALYNFSPAAPRCENKS